VAIVTSHCLNSFLSHAGRSHSILALSAYDTISQKAIGILAGSGAIGFGSIDRQIDGDRDEHQTHSDFSHGVVLCNGVIAISSPSLAGIWGVCLLPAAPRTFFAPKSGDAFVIAPDGSRAGLVWEASDKPYFQEIMPVETCIA